MAHLCRATLLGYIATLALVLRILGLIPFSPHLAFLSPLCLLLSATQHVWTCCPHTSRVRLCSPHHPSLWAAAVGFSNSCLPVSQSSYWGSLITHDPSMSPSLHPSRAAILLFLPPCRKQWVSLAAVAVSSTELSYPVWQLSSHLLHGPWRLAPSCSSGYCIFPIRELSSSEATHANFFFFPH